MKAQQGRWRRQMGSWLLAACLGCISGCMSFLHPISPTLPELAEQCKELPPYCRNHVYVFLVNGVDPFNWANLDGLCDYLHQLGFAKTYYGQLFHTSYFAKELIRVHNEDPEAHFVLIGFSFGANMARNLAQTAASQGIDIDLLVYLGGNTLENTPRDRPANAHRLINVLAHGYIWNGAQFDDAENISVDDVWHFGSPTHPSTLMALTRDLADVAASVPIIEPLESKPVPGTVEPTPQPVAEPTANVHDDWDFLKPVSQLHPSEQSIAQTTSPASVTYEPPSAPRTTLAEIAAKR